MHFVKRLANYIKYVPNKTVSLHDSTGKAQNSLSLFDLQQWKNRTKPRSNQDQELKIENN